MNWKKLWAGWKRFGEIIGNFLARIVLTIFYFTVFVPFAIGVRLLSDPLKIKELPAALWQPRSTGAPPQADALRQF